MFDWLKKLFSKPTPAADKKPELQTKPCKSCGKPVSFNPSWQHIPNYCPECKAKYRAEHKERKMIRRTCRSCGRTFTFPSIVKHYPNYCRECQANRKRAPR